MNFFESELRKLFEDGQVMDDPTFSGRICMGTLSKDVRVRVQFITGMIASQYDALKISVLNRTEGAIDTHVLKLRDVLGKKLFPEIPTSVRVFSHTSGTIMGRRVGMPINPTRQTAVPSARL